MRRYLLFTLLFAGACPALGYVRATATHDPGSPCTWWGPRQVSYWINQNGSSGMPGQPGFDAVANGFAAWTTTNCSDFSFLNQGTTADQQVGYSGIVASQPMLSTDVPDQHIVVFRDQLCAEVVDAGDDCLLPQNDDCDSIYGCWPADVDTNGDTLAYTLVTSEVSTGQIVDADTAFDEADFQFRDLTMGTCDPGVDVNHCADLQNTMAHEAGHFLGLAHSADPNATMYGQVIAPLEITKRVLGTDDVAGLCAMYPAGQPSVTCVPPPASAVSGHTAGCDSTDAFGLLAACASLAVWTRRRRPRSGHPIPIDPVKSPPRTHP